MGGGGDDVLHPGRCFGSGGGRLRASDQHFPLLVSQRHAAFTPEGGVYVQTSQ